MKKTILCAIVALVAFIAPTSALAQEVSYFKSDVTGFTCIVPDDANVMKNDLEAIILMTENQEFTVSVVPFDPTQTDDATRATALKTLAENANLNFDTAIDVDLNNTNLEGAVFIQQFENGGCSCVAAMKAKAGNLAFFVVVVASPNYVGMVDSILKSIDFDPDAIK